MADGPINPQAVRLDRHRIFAILRRRSVSLFADGPAMTTIHARFALVALCGLCLTAGCRNNQTRDDPFNQRRIIPEAPAASYAPPNVQFPGATGVPPLQPVPGSQPGVQTAPGTFRPASATSPAAATSNDGWVPADKSTTPPPDHSAQLSKASETPVLQPVNSAQSVQPGPAPAASTTAALGWTPPRMP
jgi:hypothetical protein